MTLEPYTLRYAKIFCAAGRIRVERFCLKEVANPAVKGAKFSFADEKLEKIYRAALNTFAYNCVDIFMDCPSRERAGWLCDGYFTGRVEHLLTGENRTEHDFLENFLLPKKFERLPKGMLPMCYPSDHPDGNFIPTWAMWFVLELDRYASESGDQDMAERARHKIYALLEYFSAFENEFGLLEDLEGWVFIEWSKAAEFTNGVNFCVNMLYALTLETVGKLYRDEAALQRAARMREKIRELSFDGLFFTDHAVRKEGVLTPAKDTTEVCQYYAFFTETATPERYPALWQTLLSDFGPDRKKTGPLSSRVARQCLYRQLFAAFALGALRLRRTVDQRDPRLFYLYGGQDDDALGKRHGRGELQSRVRLLRFMLAGNAQPNQKEGSIT